MADDSPEQARLESQRDDLRLLNQVMRHDIRNDLQLIGAYAELLEDHVDEEGEQYLDIIKESTESATKLTTTARDLARVMLDTDGGNRSVSLDGVLARQVDEVRSSYPGAVITVEEPIPNVDVVGNDMLGSVFRNLLSNAVQHNDKTPPEVELSATEAGDHAEIRVADNGPGIPDTQKEDIFGKGEKGLDSSGAGIGLYLVQSLVETYGGDVFVENNDPEGSVFVVTLPTAE
ncbi:sensor histidine kinase [Natronomonas salsuginis]|jgi:signal transduction histidine kinase|uniref:HAMP domain-containing histidine kinase n=1 Tax=Natronomonas salsuginis TaxID=2217661 RepID=A0A4U5JCJ7_9EURY|nr:HAMP domain-containing sensor histidine kinase [Natronomonas salsuginis]TKR25578.1 HAMP domain-containing histidine kinase [Natronomonas salsuginis]